MLSWARQLSEFEVDRNKHGHCHTLDMSLKKESEREKKLISNKDEILSETVATNPLKAEC